MNMTSTSGELLEAPMLYKDEKCMCPSNPSFMCSYKQKDPVIGERSEVRIVRPNVCLNQKACPQGLRPNDGALLDGSIYTRSKVMCQHHFGVWQRLESTTTSFGQNQVHELDELLIWSNY